MKFLKLAILIAITLKGVSTQAQDNYYTLDNLVNKALTYNLDIQSKELETQTTEAKINEIRANGLPQVNISGDYKYYIKIPGQVIPLSAFGGPEGEYTTAGFGLPWNFSSNVQVTQAVYNHSLRIGLRAAKLGRDATSLQIKRTKEDVTYNVSATYYNTQTLAQQIKFLNDNLNSIQSSIRIAQLRYDNQMGQKIDVDRLQLNYSALETRLASIQTDYNQLLNLLKFLAGIPQEEQIRIQEEINPDLTTLVTTEDPKINRSEILLLDIQKEQNILENKNIKAGFVPTLNAYGLGNYTIFSDPGRNGYTKGIPAGWAGLQLNWNIFDGNARKAKITQNKIQQQQINLQEKQLQESIQMEISNARNKLHVQLKNLQAGKDQIAIAERVYEQAQLLFKEGTTDISTLIQTEDALRESQTNYLAALVGLRTAELDWDKATGNLLSK